MPRIRVGRPKSTTRIEYVEWTGRWDDIPAKWRASGFFDQDEVSAALIVRTLHGPVRPEVGDLLVRNPGSKDFYPIARAVYNDKYEDVTDD